MRTRGWGGRCWRAGVRFHAQAVPSDEVSAELYEQACEFLAGQRVSRSMRFRTLRGRGMQSRHNRKYWEREPYLGFGLDAHSMLMQGQG